MARKLILILADWEEGKAALGRVRSFVDNQYEYLKVAAYEVLDSSYPQTNSAVEDLAETVSKLHLELEGENDENRG